MKNVFIIVFILLIMQPIFATSYKQVSEYKYIDLDSIKQSDMSGYYLPDEYLYLTLHINDNSKFFKNLETHINTRISQILENKVIDCKDKKVMIGTISVFNEANKKILEFIYSPYSLNRFQYIGKDTLDEYNEVCK